ncbi:hypothetical protein AVEN_26033-1 [Araneus ventricosus]|uniref:Uncharacterized protein n=1 Tax=Araneus ventricosus TaxID=182803 RepID=A0A4Y2E2I9_ARAVE|nr:hypothetical protein AVEN_26033-1 [Araneus ventricosus]
MKDVSPGKFEAVSTESRGIFWAVFVTVYETRIRHYQSETKKQSKQWVARAYSASLKAKTVPSSEKAMDEVFLEARRIFLLDFLEEGNN